jgi:hypothetical protein
MDKTVYLTDETYLTERVKDQLNYYERQANKAKRHHLMTQTTLIMLGVLIPVVLNVDWFQEDRQTVVTVLSLFLAILTGWVNFRKPGDLWLSYRATEEMLKHEQYLFRTHSGDYQEADTAFPRFVERIEGIISAEHQKFRALQESAKRPTTPAATAKASGRSSA